MPRLLLLSLFLAVSLSALARPVLALEIAYPRLPGVEAPQDFMPKIQSGEYPKEKAFPLFALYLYFLFLVVATALATLSVFVGGVLYLVAGNNIGRIFAAKEQVTAAFLGLALLLTSFIFLQAINPRLLFLKLASTLPVPSPTLLPIADLTPRPGVYWELPIGQTVQRVAFALQAIWPTDPTLNNLRNLYFSARDTGCALDWTGCGLLAPRGLIQLLDYCQCQDNSYLKASCQVPIPQCYDKRSCLASNGDVASLDDVCQGQAQNIDDKRKQIKDPNNPNDLLDQLKQTRSLLVGQKIDLQIEDTRLRLLHYLLKNCSDTPISRINFLGFQEQDNLESKGLWPNDPVFKFNKNPLTFYCQIKDEVVNSALALWEQAVRDLEAERILDPGDIPDPPPGGGATCGNGLCEFGENNSSCPDDCLPDYESFPFDWPLPPPITITQNYGDNSDLYGGAGHNGLDMVGANAEVRAAAAGKVIGAGNMSDAENCPKGVCANGETAPGFAYGAWLAVEHQVLYNSQTPVRYVTLYAHLDPIDSNFNYWQTHCASPDSNPLFCSVVRGQAVATMDNSGFSCRSHLHFGLYLSNYSPIPAACNPDVVYPTGTAIDPRPFLPFSPY